MQKSDTIRIPAKTKKELEKIMTKMGYPSISYTVARVVGKSGLNRREKIWFWGGICVGICIGAVVAAFTVAFMV